MNKNNVVYNRYKQKALIALITFFIGISVFATNHDKSNNVLKLLPSASTESELKLLVALGYQAVVITFNDEELEKNDIKAQMLAKLAKASVRTGFINKFMAKKPLLRFYEFYCSPDEMIVSYDIQEITKDNMLSFPKLDELGLISEQIPHKQMTLHEDSLLSSFKNSENSLQNHQTTSSILVEGDLAKALNITTAIHAPTHKVYKKFQLAFSPLKLAFNSLLAIGSTYGLGSLVKLKQEFNKQKQDAQNNFDRLNPSNETHAKKYRLDNPSLKIDTPVKDWKTFSTDAECVFCMDTKASMKVTTEHGEQLICQGCIESDPATISNTCQECLFYDPDNYQAFLDSYKETLNAKDPDYTKNLLSLYEKKWCEDKLKSLGSIKKCINSRCAHYLPLEQQVCPLCATNNSSTEECADCHLKEGHEGACQFIIDKDLTELIRTGTIRPCPKCGTLTQKSEGCDHILCGDHAHGRRDNKLGCGHNWMWNSGNTQNGVYNERLHGRSYQLPDGVCIGGGENTNKRPPTDQELENLTQHGPLEGQEGNKHQTIEQILAAGRIDDLTSTSQEEYTKSQKEDTVKDDQTFIDFLKRRIFGH